MSSDANKLETGQIARELIKNSIWDWKTRRKINKFSNQNVPGSSISGIHFINEGASSLILTASSKCFDIPISEEIEADRK